LQVESDFVMKNFAKSLVWQMSAFCKGWSTLFLSLMLRNFMKHTTFWSSQKMTAIYSGKLMTAIALVGVLSIGGGIVWADGASATPTLLSKLDLLKQENTSGRRAKKQRLPAFLASTVRGDLANKLGVSTSKVRVTGSERTVWPNTCLGLPGGEELCSFVETEGWKITLSANRQTWVYRTDLEGRVIRAETPSAAEKPPVVETPPVAEKPPTSKPEAPSDAVMQAVLKAASERLQTPTSNLKVTQTESQTWSDGCLGLGGPAESCLAALVPGWRITVTSGSQRLVYRTSLSGSAVRLDEAASQINTTTLPRSVERAVLQAAAKQTGLRLADLEVVRSKSIVTDGCLSLPAPGEACIEVALNAWQITVSGGEQQLIYRSNDTGSQVRLERQIDRIGQSALEPTILTDAEIPPALGEGIIFRSIATGGITGRTYQTLLLSDGRLIQIQPDTKNKEGTQRQIRRLSRRQVDQFVQLLRDQQFDQFDRLNYPASAGSADFMVVTMTSTSGTTRYSDSVLNQLPSSLQSVIRAWNQMAK
jgi:hypothetical protein